MKSQNSTKMKIGPFITTIAVLAVIIISWVLVVISQANAKVRKSTEEHIISDMTQDLDGYVETINLGINNGFGTLTKMLASDSYTYKIIFVVDTGGNIVAQSNLARYTVSKKNIFDYYSDAGYDVSVDEKTIREALTSSENGSLTVMHRQKEYIVYQPLWQDDQSIFYVLRQDEADEIYSEGTEYLTSLQLLSVAYVIVTIALTVMIISHIISLVKTFEPKLRLSNIKVRDAEEQVRIYSNITRVLAQSYEKVFYVNLADESYKVFASTIPDNGQPLLSEGTDFWNTVCRNIIDRTVENDLPEIQEFLNKETLSEYLKENSNRRLRFRMDVDGTPVYYYLKAFLLESEGQQYFVIGLKNVDALVIHDLNQLAEKEAALRRVDIYRNALLDNMVAYLELNISQGTIVEGPFIGNKEAGNDSVNKSFNMPKEIDKLVEIWSNYLYSDERDRENYIRQNSSEYLKNEYQNGNSVVEYFFDAKWEDGSVRNIRQNYYLSKSEESGDIVALCVLYDITEKKARDTAIKNLTEELTQSRIKISTSQMQPHFLYNVLGSIREIILEDPQYASDLICDFTTHLRACIKSLSNDDLVPFSKEVENIQAYVNIERMRFGDRMKVEFDIQYDDFDVVPLSIQPLVENAIRHGLFQKKDGMGVVKISAFSKNGFAVIVVNDNGVGFDYKKINQEIAEHKRDSTGLLNLTLRLEKLLNAKVYFDSKIDEGTTVTILIPDKKEDGNE